MALTKAILQSNTLLSGLTEEQINAITILSQNDENSVIGARFRETYNLMDETIATNLGIARNGDEKTYKYLERASKEFANKYADYDKTKSSYAALQKEHEELRKKFAEGADPEVARQLTQAKADLEAVKKQFGAVKSEYESAKAEWAKSEFDMRVNSVLDAARSSIKLRSDVNQKVADLAMQVAYARVRSFSPSFEDDGKGGKTLLFHNADGSTMNNAEKQLAPYTAADLLARELAPYDIIEKGTPVGTGGKTVTPTGGGLLAGVATQVQAREAISKDLAARGITISNPQWQSEFDKTWDAGKVNELPLQ